MDKKALNNMKFEMTVTIGFIVNDEVLITRNTFMCKWQTFLCHVFKKISNLHIMILLEGS